MKTVFVRLLFVSLCINYFVPVKAAKYYFSSLTGDDSRTNLQAQNPCTPWKTLSKLNSFFPNLQPGDAILFKRGETFYGQIIVKKSGSVNLPITITDYGSGVKPVISGFVKLSSWTARGNGIWETTNSELTNSVSILTINGRVEPMGRYPNADAANKGYLTYESHVGNTRITDNQLSSNQDWTNAEIVIRKNRWILDRGTITRHSGTSLTYSGSSHYQAEDNFGYFIQNHLATLDKSGEWYFDKAAKKIFIYLSNGIDPNKTDIKVSFINTIVQNSKENNIKLQNLLFEGANNTIFSVSETENVSISNCTIKTSINGIIGQYNTSLLVENSEISNLGNNSIYLTSAAKAIIRNNIISNTGTISGMGMNGDDTYQAIILRGSANLVEKNTVTNIGYSAIRFEGDYTIIQNNFVSHFNLVKDDGGGIYSWNGDSTYPEKGSKVLSNIVVNGVGAGQGTSDPMASATNGIYMDDNTGSVEIKGNTVAFCNGGGIFLHNANHIDVSDNTIFGNESQLFMLQNSLHQIRNNSIYRNKFFSKNNTQLVSKLHSTSNDIKEFSSFDHNYYCRPLDDQYIISTYSNYQLSSGVYAMHTLPKWKTLFNLDLNSKITPIQLPSYHLKALIGSNKFSNGNFANHINNAYCWSASNNISLAWSNTGGLDGGCLKASFDTAINPAVQDRSALITMDVGEVSTTKKYILKFSLRGNNSQQSFQVFLRKRDFPYNDLSPRYQCDMSSARVEKEFALSFPVTETNAYLVFQVDQADGIFFVDNLQLHEADLLLTDPDDYIRFEYNASNNNKIISLNNTTYIDVENRTYQGNITLAPWSSVILLKKPATTSSKATSYLPPNTTTTGINSASVTAEQDVKLVAKDSVPTLVWNINQIGSSLLDRLAATTSYAEYQQTDTNQPDSSTSVTIKIDPHLARLMALADDAIEKPDLKVTPNPTEEEFEVSFYTPKQTISELIVIDELGRTWYKKLVEGKEFQRQKIHVPGAAGYYILVVRQGDKIFSKKIIIR